ncbi:major facilitator superfamily domain-containing protein [Xylaria sp. CBS 124048]|nr:major facilitator superfamily domain-containing protein [Xylaria sp. CBS 124048]
MVWGILEDRHMDHVPGTVLLADARDMPGEYREIPRTLLKHGRGRNGDVILVPQPSDSPNDPLNWPTWRKDVILAIVGLSASVVGASTSMLSPGFVKIAHELHVPVSKIAHIIAWVALVIAISLFFINPVAKKIGRRPVYVISNVITLTGAVWGAVSQSYDSLLASRIFSALGMAPFEILVQVTIADMYFVHERATRIAIWNMFLLCGYSGGPLVAGNIIEGLGWKWTLISCGILFGVLLPLIIFFVPETAYQRLPSQRRSVVSATNDSVPSSEKSNTTVERHDKLLVPETGVGVEPKVSYLRSLRLYNGVYTKTPLWKIFLRPMVMLWYPAVFWAFLIFGTGMSSVAVFAVVNAVIFTAPPYDFSISQTGLTTLSPFILTLVGELVAGLLNDRLCLQLAKRNHGIYEPEFRLPPMMLAAIVGAAGYFGFAAAIHYRTHWSGPVLCYGLSKMAVALSSASVFGYVVDAHMDLREEAFVAINTRNLLTFAFTFFVNDWLARDGAQAVFNTLGGVWLAVNVLTIPLWIFGKRMRGYIARNEGLRRFLHED